MPDIREISKTTSLWPREHWAKFITGEPELSEDWHGWSGTLLTGIEAAPPEHEPGEHGSRDRWLYSYAIGRAIIAAMRPDPDPLHELRAEIIALRDEVRALRNEVQERAGSRDEPNLSIRPPGIKLSKPTQSAELTGLADDRLQLVLPISVTVEVLGDRVVISDEDVNIYGTGETLDRALGEYWASVVEYYDWLISHEATLASHLRAHLDWLREHLRPRG
jgi:hypothetical protein